MSDDMNNIMNQINTMLKNNEFPDDLKNILRWNLKLIEAFVKAPSIWYVDCYVSHYNYLYSVVYVYALEDRYFNVL